jgi:hypothetical protein
MEMFPFWPVRKEELVLSAHGNFHMVESGETSLQVQTARGKLLCGTGVFLEESIVAKGQLYLMLYNCLRPSLPIKCINHTSHNFINSNTSYFT